MVWEEDTEVHMREARFSGRPFEDEELGALPCWTL
jgi:hypothetical protein